MAIVVPQIEATIPDGIADLESFRHWARSDNYPRQGRFGFFKGNLWMDLSMENAFSHNLVKTEVARVLSTIAKDEDTGLYLSDGMLLSNPEVGLSTIPDGVFVAHVTFDSGEVRRIQGSVEGDFVELVGTPDMVLEVVSKSSEEKDTVDLPELYWQAGIAEYWLVDARRDPLQFDLFRRGSRSYSAAKPLAGGWRKSNVFGRSYRLTRGADRAGNPKFVLESR